MAALHGRFAWLLCKVTLPPTAVQPVAGCHGTVVLFIVLSFLVLLSRVTLFELEPHDFAGSQSPILSLDLIIFV